MDPRPASTVILARDAQEGSIEVFMLRRSSASRFAPDAYVFPGGSVDARDRDQNAHAATLGLSSERLSHLFRMDSPPDVSLQMALVAAALRELYEESGVLFASNGESSVTMNAEDARDFYALLATHGWKADARPLEIFSRWITPDAIAPRFDAFFFVARMPHGQTPTADAYETHDGLWIAPADALRRDAEGTFSVIFPTRKHLERLCAFASVDGLLTFARTKPIRTVHEARAEHAW